MGLTSIEWTDFTFNPWWGCSKVSAGCANCYAEGVAERFASGNLWGKDAQRKHASDKVWNDPLRWNRAAAKAGRRDLVFCASMADVFEDRPDLVIARESLWQLIRTTPNLRWLLLTKRPENFHLLPPDVAALVALGVSVENQEAADKRIPLLLAAPAAIRFVSCEPLLGHVVLGSAYHNCLEGWYTEPQHDPRCDGSCILGCPIPVQVAAPALDWVICGGESGKGARPMHPDWARSLRDQCQAASVPFMFKQWGEFRPSYHAEPYATSMDGKPMTRCGKLAAGRLLDGREWLEFPENLREAQP